MVACGLVLIGSRYGQVAASCEGGNEHSVSLRNWKFPDYLRNYSLLKKDSAS